MLINTNCIIDFNRLDKLRYLAAFLLFKSKYSNSCVYDYTENSLAQKTGLSRSSVRKYIKYFVSRGYVHYHGKNLVFNKLKDVDGIDHKDLTIIEPRGLTITQITRILYKELLKRRQRGFEFARQLNRDLTTACYKTQRRAKILKKRLNREKKLPGENDDLCLSFKSLAALLNCSKSKAHGIINHFKRDFAIVSSQKVVLAKGISRNVARVLLMDNPGAFFYNGAVIKNSCNKYFFL